MPGSVPAAGRSAGPSLAGQAEGRRTSAFASNSAHIQRPAVRGSGRLQGQSREPDKGSGYVVHSLEAALWCFWRTDSFAACVLLAANLGDDADTTAAVAGRLAGAFYGESGIPAPWLRKLAMVGDIGQWAEQLVLQKPKG